MKLHTYCNSFWPNNISLQEYTAKILCLIVYYFSIAAITYYHKFSSLKQDKFVISQSKMAWQVSMLQVSQGQNQCWLAWILYLGTLGKNPLPSSLQLYKSIPCKYTIGPSFLCWLSASGHYWLPEGSFQFMYMGFSISVPATGDWILFTLGISLTSLSVTSLLFPVRESYLFLWVCVVRLNSPA